jgi:GNAT superfamily N-acetyltransferase
MTTWTIQRCCLARVLPLRSLITYGGARSCAESVSPLDEGEGAAHYVVRAGGADIAMASLFYSPRVVCGVRAEWMLGFLGVCEEWRGRGIGSALVMARREEVRRRGGDVAWCDARVGKIGMYERLGARGCGGAYDVPGTGLHMDMLYGGLGVSREITS